jgi:PIN domain nuclease of toxin-antitoxin system
MPLSHRQIHQGSHNAMKAGATIADRDSLLQQPRHDGGSRARLAHRQYLRAARVSSYASATVVRAAQRWLRRTTSATERGTRALLDQFTLLPIDDAIAERAVALPWTHRMRLPDAVVRASAQVHSMLLVTRDAKAFPVGEPGIRMPYAL